MNKIVTIKSCDFIDSTYFDFVMDYYELICLSDKSPYTYMAGDDCKFSLFILKFPELIEKIVYE